MARKVKSEDLGGDIYAKFAALNESFKKDNTGAIMIDSSYDEKKVPTGSIVLDNVLKLEGLPFGGRVIHIHGKEHGGKSTICYHMVKNYQKATKMPAVIFDFEGTATVPYLTSLGMDLRPERLVVWKISNTEDCIQKAVEYMEMGIKLFIFDSIPKMKQKRDKKDVRSGQVFKPSVGEHARQISRFFDILLPYAMQHDCLFIMVNQIRARIDGSQEAAMAQKYPSFTNLPYVLPGGNSVRYVPSLMIEVNTAKALRGATDDPFLMEAEPDNNTVKATVATRVKVRILKNKVTMGSYREYPLYIRTFKGVDDWMSVRELARSYGLIRNKGSKWIVGIDENVITTYDNKEQAIRDLVYDQNMEVLTRLREQVVAAIASDDTGSFDTTLTEGEMMVAGHKEDGIDMGELDTSALDPDDDDEF
jgi:RecA/RadA recombinase